MEIKKILFLILMLSLFIPQFILAEEGTLVIDASSSSSMEHSVRSDMGAFVNGFQGLFKGDTDAFVEGLVQALPLFGLVIIVFGLGYYLSLITIFKGDGKEKFAKIFATGLALLGLAQQKIYDLVLGLSTALLSIIYILLFFFIIILFWNTMRSSQLSSSTTLTRTKTANLGAESKYDKARHELNKDRRLHRKSEHILGSLADDLDDVYDLSGDELNQIKKLIQLVGKIKTAEHNGDKDKVHGLVQMFGRQIGSLITSMKHTDADYKKINTLVDRLSYYLEYAHAEGNDEAKKLRNILVHYSKKTHGNAHISDEKAEELVKKTDVKEKLDKIRHQNHNLIQFEKKLQEELKNLNDVNYTKKHSAA
ncbi:MAG: hypothetical protein PHU51_05970, partial [Candidatus Nanoarchaeia archaeon]|nr:hypothetical protein [Candidatus Nanoarchaeia archaeon]